MLGALASRQSSQRLGCSERDPEQLGGWASSYWDNQRVVSLSEKNKNYSVQCYHKNHTPPNWFSF